MLEQNRRLQQIAALVRPGVRVVDVGTDHGLLITQLLLDGTATFGVACDINPMPLEKARQSLAHHGLEDKSCCILCDGLEQVSPQLADDIVIAGMGGELIAQIIEKAPWLKDRNRHLILQPMSRAPLLRSYLSQNGFVTQKELAVASGDFIYNVLLVSYTGECYSPSLLECWIGKVIEGGTPDTAAYLLRLERNVTERIDGLSRAKHPGSQLETYRTLQEQIRQKREELS